MAAPVRANPGNAIAPRAVARSDGANSDKPQPPWQIAEAALDVELLNAVNESQTVDTQHPHPLELKIPPLVLVIVAGALMSLFSFFAPKLNFDLPFHSIIAWAFAMLGVLASALGVIEFKRAKTTLNPTKPQSSSTLVTSGIYRRSRNPMYLGFFLVLLGWAVSTANAAAFLAMPAFVLYMNRFQIRPEERMLMSIFGDEFKSYVSIVGRWI